MNAVCAPLRGPKLQGLMPARVILMGILFFIYFSFFHIALCCPLIFQEIYIFTYVYYIYYSPLYPRVIFHIQSLVPSLILSYWWKPNVLNDIKTHKYITQRWLCHSFVWLPCPVCCFVKSIYHASVIIKVIYLYDRYMYQKAGRYV